MPISTMATTFQGCGEHLPAETKTNFVFTKYFTRSTFTIEGISLDQPNKDWVITLCTLSSWTSLFESAVTFP